MSPTPLLDSLELSSADREALSTNGFVHSERRGERILFKLRYRVGGKQRVRCLGFEASRAAAVEQELQTCQSLRLWRRNVRRWVDGARQALRATKARMGPVVLAAGYHYHGRAIRRRRGQSKG